MTGAYLELAINGQVLASLLRARERRFALIVCKIARRPALASLLRARNDASLLKNIIKKRADDLATSNCTAPDINNSMVSKPGRYLCSQVHHPLFEMQYRGDAV